MISLQDEFDMGRIPIRPLQYQNKNKAHTKELMIDSYRDDPDEKPTFHIYISDAVDRSTIYDLTQIMINEAFAGKEIYVDIDGVDKPLSIYDAINYIYRRFIHIDNPDGFDLIRDKEKITIDSNKIALLKDINDEYIFPVTRADAIFDRNGNTIQSRLDNSTRVGFASDYIKVSYEDQSTFEITYPFPNYRDGGNFMQLYVGTTVIDKSRYSINEVESDDGKVYGCTINFFTDTFEIGRRIDILFIFNTPSIDGKEFEAIDGHILASHTLPIEKIEKYSNSYTLNDSSSIATSKAVCDLYEATYEMIVSKGSKAVYAKDLSPNSPSTITVNTINDEVILSGQYILISVITQSSKNKNLTLSVISMKDKITKQSITTNFNIDLLQIIGPNKLVRFLVNQDEAMALNVTDIKLNNSRYIHYCEDAENVISFKGLDYSDSSILKVYRNGVRLFKDMDYSLNYSTETITLFVRTQAKEKIIFESEYISF